MNMTTISKKKNISNIYKIKYSRKFTEASPRDRWFFFFVYHEPDHDQFRAEAFKESVSVHAFEEPENEREAVKGSKDEIV